MHNQISNFLCNKLFPHVHIPPSMVESVASGNGLCIEYYESLHINTVHLLKMWLRMRLPFAQPYTQNALPQQAAIILPIISKLTIGILYSYSSYMKSLRLLHQFPIVQIPYIDQFLADCEVLQWRASIY